MSEAPAPTPPLTSAAGSGKSRRTFYVAFCTAKKPSWWMRWFLKPGFSHVLVLQPIVHEFEIDGKPVYLENCFSVEYAGYAIVQQYYRWIKTPFEHLPAAAIAEVWARNGWRVVHIEREIDADKTLIPICNPIVNCVTLAKCLMGVSCLAQTPHQLYQWLLRNGGTETAGG